MRAWLPTLAGVVTLAVLGPAAPARAEVFCKMNVAVAPASPYAAAYSDEMTVTVRSKEGRSLTPLKAELYTFKGRRLGRGTRRGQIGPMGTASIRLRLDYPMQAGKFTVVVSELRRAACGNPKRSRVITLRGCPGALPARLTRFSALVPGAQDVSDVIGAGGGAFIRGIDSRLYDPAGSLVGQATLDVLFGRETLDHALTSPLVTGTYTQVISGRPDGLPPACPDPTLVATLDVP